MALNHALERGMVGRGSLILLLGRPPVSRWAVPCCALIVVSSVDPAASVRSMSSIPRRVLVTGATGCLGGGTARYLAGVPRTIRRHD